MLPPRCLCPTGNESLPRGRYRWFQNKPHIRPCAYLYRSTDCGQTFEPGVQLDTFNYFAGNPHVVADRDNIICDYDGESFSHRDSTIAEARTYYTQGDSWGIPTRVANLDSIQELYLNGTLALSGDGRVHAAMMVEDTVVSRYGIYYTFSLDHGVSWSDIELVYQDTTEDSWYPDVGTDSAGHAYVIWQQDALGLGEILFATNNPAGIAEEPVQQPVGVHPLATVIRGVLFLPISSSHKPQAASLLDISGRQVVALKPGANDVSALAPGVYFVREAQAQAQAVRKVVVAR